MLRKFLVLVVGGLLTSALLAGASVSTAGAEKRAPAAKASPVHPWPGDATKLTGRIAPTARVVVLQTRRGGTWVNIRKARTAKHGRYAFTVRARKTAARYRTVAPRAVIGSKTHPRVVSRPVLVVGKAPRVRLTLASNPVVEKNGQAYTRGRITVASARKNVRVVVQRRTRDGWRTVRKGALVKGRYQFALRAGAYEYRAVAQPRGSSARALSRRVKNGWRLAWHDEFTNVSQSLRTWQDRDRGRRHSRRVCSTTDPGQTTYNGHVMRLRVGTDSRLLQDPAGEFIHDWASRCPNGTYLNAMVGTQLSKKFTYGVFAARVRFQAPQGMHGSFWLQSNGTPEIDVVEYFGDGRSDGGLSTYLHSKPNARGESVSVGGVLKSADRLLNRGGRTPASGFHVYSVEWTSAGYVFRIDGEVTFRTKRLRSDDPHFLVLSLITSDWEMPKLKRSELPQAHVDVDWVRVWQK